MKPNEAQVNDALASIARAEGRPLIEATIGPAEVQYMHVRLDIWRQQQDAIDQLKGELNAESELCMAVMRASAEKDREYRAAQHSGGLLAMLAVVGWAAFAVAAFVAVWRLA